MKWVRLMTINYREEVRRLIKGKVLFNVPMKRFTSMKVGGPVDGLLFPRNVGELKKVVRYARKKSIPVMILGKGTNMIVRDKGIRGWMISVMQGLKKIRAEGEVVEAEAGVPLQRLVQFSVQKGLTGFEPFYGIPGTVGGGLAMNAGAWGSELKDILLSMTLMKENGDIVERPRSKLRFSYRGLVLPSKWIILKGEFQLKKGKKKEMVERIKSYSEQRRKKQPLDYPSAGSVFKNPAGGPAGRWIEEAGLKGYQVGQAMVSERHANFIINLGNATATDVIHLMEWVEKRVFEERGVSLEREVKVVGE
jgi:UDP-N-acetylmuramate dehydrogenase